MCKCRDSRLLTPKELTAIRKTHDFVPHILAMALPTLWRSTPKATRAVVIALFWTSLTIAVIKIAALRDPTEERSYLEIIIPYIQLVPRYTIFYPWVLVTAIFAEVSIFSFIFALGILYVATGYLEKFWGPREVVKFILIVGTLTNLSTVIVTILSNMVRGDVLGMDKPLGGGISYFFGFLVVLKQLIPEHNVVLFQGLVNFRIKHTPFIVLIAVIVASSITQSLWPVVPSVFSFFISYNYLRFYQTFQADPLLPVTSVSGDGNNTTVMYGDASDAFQLVEFFPGVSKAFLAPIVNSIYDVSVLIGIVTPFNEEAIEQSNLRVQKLSEQAKKATKLTSVAERRRQVALQVIEDRINQN